MVNAVWDTWRRSCTVSFLVVWHISKSHFVSSQKRLKTICFHAMPCSKSLPLQYVYMAKLPSLCTAWEVSQQYKCCFRVSGCLFYKVEPSLPKQNSVWIMGFACLTQGYSWYIWVTSDSDCTITLQVFPNIDRRRPQPGSFLTSFKWCCWFVKKKERWLSPATLFLTFPLYCVFDLSRYKET